MNPFTAHTEEIGMSRVGPVNTLLGSGKPSFATIMRISRALDMRLRVAV